MQTGAILFLAFIIVQRLSELAISKANTKRLIERGAYEVGANHYPAMVAMHSAWIACLVLFGIGQSVSPFWLILFVVLQAFRIWILASLGSRWTTRIIILEEPLVTRGPFKFIRHPNYALVVAEIIVAPMVLGLWWVAVLFTILNAAMLYVRIGAEEKALSPLRGS
ncbi:isoprenylcysteine carboxylmethyltransferase family protein [Amylibacter sp. IMCC11727]|uniref:isoprenylcysteine carboxyl methyltransferase family protein n=1 Tax=Amylibacter sp. IMCC11727 TaxID=3039851 RepID=UPI00244DB2A3|nr:isoprenylcysteine carboxylmethyltransferase family protein [Amylibacter sp. IMCC11727]WGI21734.1 isoprenylcysteine carboxylmethyltransferase family protein [Amylibacter sp. IMCC11727]